MTTADWLLLLCTSFWCNGGDVTMHYVTEQQCKAVVTEYRKIAGKGGSPRAQCFGPDGSRIDSTDNEQIL